MNKEIKDEKASEVVIEEQGFEPIPEDTLISVEEAVVDKSKIEIAAFIPFNSKLVLIDKVIDVTLTKNESGMLERDYATGDLALKCNLVVNYTNISLEGVSIVDAYDAMCQNGILNYVLFEIDKSELDFIEKTLYANTQEKILLNNSLEAIINRGIENLVSKIPDEKGMLKTIKALKGLDTSKMEWLDSITEALKGVKDKTTENTEEETVL